MKLLPLLALLALSGLKLAGQPSVTGVSPNSGGSTAGNPQTFSFTFSDPNGWSNIQWVQLLFNTTSGSQTNACYFHFYAPSGGLIHLANDSVTSWPNQQIGTAGTLSNSQCSVNVGASSASGSGTTLTVTLAVTFTTSFAGAKNIYAQAMNNGGIGTGWRTIGNWTISVAPTFSSVSVAPSSGVGYAGDAQPFTFTFSDTNGWSDIQWVDMLFNTTAGTQTNACYFHFYVPSGGIIHLANDSVTSWPNQQIGTAGTLSNSQCSLNVGASSYSVSGTTLTVTLAITFTAPFAGAKNVYAQGGTVGGYRPGWQTMGSWTVSAVPVTTLTSNPTGLTVVADGQSCTAPCQFLWPTGSQHTISAPDQTGGPNIRYAKAVWSPAGGAIVVPSMSKTYTATFTTQYPLTATASPASGGSILPGSGWVDAGLLAITATPNPGYGFAGFSGGLSGTTNPQNVTVTGPLSVTASFGPLVSVTLLSSPSGLSLTADGSSCIAPCAFQWIEGSSHTIAVPPSPQAATLAGARYVYTGWSDLGGQSRTILASSSTPSYRANFKTQYLLTASASATLPAGGSLSALPDCRNWCDSGSSVAVAANPNNGSTFAGWSGALSGGSATQTLTMNGPKSVTANFYYNPPLITSPSNLPPGSVGASYNYTFQVSGGIPYYTISLCGFCGAMPPGLSIVPSGPNAGLISGTPTQAGTYTFDVSVGDQNNIGGTSSSYTIAIGGGSTISTNCVASANPTVGSPLTFTASASGGSGGYSFTWTGSVAGSGQTASFTPAAAQTYVATVTVRDSSGSQTASTCAANVQSAGNSLRITSLPTLPGGTAGTDYTAYLSATGGQSPYSWSLSSGTLPSGLNITTTGGVAGVIAGTPAATGDAAFVLRVTDKNGQYASANVSLRVAPLPSNLAVACTVSQVVNLPGDAVAYSAAVSGGAPPYSYSWSGATSGSTQSVTTVLPSTGTYTGNLTVTDSQGVSLPASCSAVATNLSAGYDCRFQGAYGDNLYVFEDGRVFAYYAQAIGWAASPISDWRNQVAGAYLNTPSGARYGPSNGQVTIGAAPSEVQFPATGYSNLSTWGFGTYTLGATMYVSNPYCGLYYNPQSFSIDFPQPTLSSLSPNYGVIGTVTARISATGTSLSGTTAVVITDQNGNAVQSIPAAFDIDSDSGVNFSLDLSGAGVAPGFYNIALLSFGVTTGSMSFLVSDTPPYITGIQAVTPVQPGSQTAIISIFGENFGAGCGNLPCPGAGINICLTGSIDPCSPPADPTMAIGYTITYWSPNQINVQLSVGANASGFFDVQVISAGATGAGFLPAPTPGQAAGQAAPSNRETFASTPNTNIRAIIKSNGSQLSGGQCAYISATPQMPQVTAYLVDGAGNRLTSGTSTFNIKTEFKYWTRDIIPKGYGPAREAEASTTTADPQQQYPASQIWNASFPSIFGGNATLSWTYQETGPGVNGTFSFRICGQNPDQATAAAAISGNSPLGNQYWFAPRIAVHETHTSQFCDGTPPSTSAPYCQLRNTALGVPIFGKPAGYGLLQLDPVDSVDQLFDWRRNVTGALGRLDLKAGPIRDTSNAIGEGTDSAAYAFWIRQVKQWYIYNQGRPPSAQISGPPGDPVVEGEGTSSASSCKFTLSVAPPPSYTLPPTGQPGTYWFGDAILMRQYGGANTNYISWLGPRYGSPRWSYNTTTTIIVNGQEQKHNWVYEFCTCGTEQTCRNSTPPQNLKP